MGIRTRIISVSLLACLGAGSVSATNTDPELRFVMDKLLQWLPGEYSTAPQLELEEKHGAPPDGLHPDWYRIFERVDVPHIGDHVIYGQLHIGGKDKPIVPGTQVLYIISLDAEHMAINVNGRRIKNPKNFEFAHLSPEKLKAIQIDPEYGGNCDFRWRLHGKQIVGKLTQTDEAAIDGTCSMISRKSGMAMRWDAEWVLNEDELWIFDNGYIDGEVLFQGRADLTHVRLTKIDADD